MFVKSNCGSNQVCISPINFLNKIDRFGERAIVPLQQITVQNTEQQIHNSRCLKIITFLDNKSGY